MAVAKITGQGLVSIAILVALLWGCLIAAHVTVRRADAGAAHAMRAMRELRMKKRREPAAAPVHPRHRRREA